MWPFTESSRQVLEPAPIAPPIDRVEEATRLRREAKAKLDGAAAEQFAFRREYHILTKVICGIDTGMILSCRIPAGSTRRCVDAEWLRLCQRVGRTLREFSLRQSAESEAKKEAAKCHA